MTTLHCGIKYKENCASTGQVSCPGKLIYTDFEVQCTRWHAILVLTSSVRAIKFLALTAQAAFLLLNLFAHKMYTAKFRKLSPASSQKK